MNTTSPFSFLESVANRLQPPAWLVEEGQQRLVLFLNHVLMQEKEAMSRLARQKGRVVHLRWGVFALDLLVTPAGLADRAPASLKPDLVLTVAVESPLTLAQSVLDGKPPPVKIDGDVQLAAELAWLTENLRWDLEEDLSRVIGDVPAHALAGAGRRVLDGLRDLAARMPRAQGAASSAPASAPAPMAPATAWPSQAPGTGA